MSQDISESKKPSIAGTIIDESVTKQDFELTKLYQSYSSELLRIAIAGTAVVGFLIQHLKILEKHYSIKILIGAGIILFAVSSALSLLHKYFSTDSMAYFIAHLRAKTFLEENQNLGDTEKTELEKQKKTELEGFIIRAKKCDWFLRLSALTLGTGFVFMVLGIVYLLIW